MTFFFRRVAATAAVATVLVAATACGGDAGAGTAPVADVVDPALADLVEAAKSEGSLTVYGTPSQEALQADADAFARAYDISVEFVQVTAGPFTVRVDQELTAGQVKADVLLTTDTIALDRWHGAGRLADLPKVDYPPTDKAYYAPIQRVGQGIVYNTSKIAAADLPTTWGDLLDPRWSGLLALGSPRIGPGYIGVYQALLASPDYGEAYFDRLATNRPRVLESPALVSQAIVSGEAAIGFTGFEYLATNVKKNSPDAPIGFSYLDIGPVVDTQVAMTKDAPSKAAAELFVRWLMSPDGQAVHNGDERATSPLGEYESTLGAVPQGVALPVSLDELVAAQPDIISMFDRLFG